MEAKPDLCWSTDVVHDQFAKGRRFRIPKIIDGFTHECLAIGIDRRLKSIDVVDVLSELFILRGVPGHIRSDNGPAFVAKAVQKWIAAVRARTTCITLGSPWENGLTDSFNARPRDELLDGEILHSRAGAKIVIASWRRRNPIQLCRPRWRRGCQCTNMPNGPLCEG